MMFNLFHLFRSQTRWATVRVSFIAGSLMYLIFRIVPSTLDLKLMIGPEVWGEQNKRASGKVETIKLARYPPLPGETSPCLDFFGMNGSWVQDWNYSAKYGQYRKPHVVPNGPHPEKKIRAFQANQPDAPYRWETSWKWVDNDNSTCPQIDYTMTETKICDLFQSLGVGRVLFFGDSMTQSMFASFVNLLHTSGPTQKLETTEFSKHDPKTGPTIAKIRCCIGDCTTTATTNATRTVEIPILQLRNHGGQPFIFKPREDFVFDNYTRDFISAAPNRTLAVFNLGAHYHVYQHYKEDLEKLLLVLDELERPQDLYFFRTTVPGHRNCLPRNQRTFNYTKGFRIVPLANFEDYEVTSHYDWSMMFDFNRHTKQVIENRKNRNRNDSQVAKVHILDVVNMTILRHDGHIGGRDCLHYISPGPVDWWNHLMYTTLLELAGRPALSE